MEIELATPGSAVRHASVARHITDCATRPGIVDWDVKHQHKALKIVFDSVIFLPARPASQTHDSHKGRMILNHVNPAGRIKNCGEKSAFKYLQLSF